MTSGNLPVLKNICLSSTFGTFNLKDFERNVQYRNFLLKIFFFLINFISSKDPVHRLPLYILYNIQCILYT